MSDRALGWLAILLAALLVAGALLGAQRLGYFASWEKPEFAFRNPLLDVPSGQHVMLRPIQQGSSSLRYWFGPVITEPDPANDPYPAPHAFVLIEERKPGHTAWRRQSPSFLALGQMGAMTIKEWLEEIRLVREKTRDGGERTLLRVTFGHETGATVAYFIDPERPVPGVGWFRHELYAEEGDPAVFFASEAGRTQLGED